MTGRVVGQVGNLRRASARPSTLAIHGTQLRVGQAILPAAAFQAALSALAIHSVQTVALCGRQSCLSAWRFAPSKGMKTCTGRLPIGRRMPSGPTCGPASTRFSTVQASFQAAVPQTTHAVRIYFSGFVSRRDHAAKPGKFVAYREGGLKGRLQAGLPATRNPRRRRSFFGLVSFKGRAAKPEKFVGHRRSRLKAGCSQDWLPHEKAKAGCRLNACPTKRPKSTAGLRPACFPGQAKACPTKTRQKAKGDRLAESRSADKNACPTGKAQ
jgi:hypothetical protein